MPDAYPCACQANRLAHLHLMSGEPTFEEMYAQAGADFTSLPWASLAPNRLLTDWLDETPPAPGDRSLVVGCGLGDDSEELSRRGLDVTAFDISPTAIAGCRQRFPDSKVKYHVADVLDPPGDWRRAFDTIVEIRTLQSLPPGTRDLAARAIAGLLAPGGRLLVICFARDDSHPPDTRPWPVSRRELEAFTAAGLDRVSFAEVAVGDAGRRTFIVGYSRSGAPDLGDVPSG
jgi:SAM-dependent methyltransferase